MKSLLCALILCPTMAFAQIYNDTMANERAQEMRSEQQNAIEQQGQEEYTMHNQEAQMEQEQFQMEQRQEDQQRQIDQQQREINQYNNLSPIERFSY